MNFSFFCLLSGREDGLVLSQSLHDESLPCHFPQACRCTLLADFMLRVPFADISDCGVIDHPSPRITALCIPMSLNNSDVYLAVTLARSSPFYSNPSRLSAPYPTINHVGNVGQLPDVQLFSVPKVEWDSQQQDILSFLKGSEGVQRVDVQSPKTRSKRDEL